ncbi:MAG: UDP-3-O-acyl-N-acetylglucosamine deacetylase [Alphaproteobacteria bacterium]|nr:UDP-3-O-acyl-N-acetylglucosamine deacetylase [Alphaproteobacteria bacterium]MCD8519807.1 UDP-3-O-acyl-N-acetylglucosamine deacetylase [Alphaproteobacteria bacterium]MCD8525624.1 UDP-3-O-acyl-N-acetylglucosamine deacetylase [Alphaproteobacteria bacterium]MCD8569998.1 UDP-3-O-acyl-N-acetylglucosamine deacetylase [Alphaproteobacteria bacterium]
MQHTILRPISSHELELEPDHKLGIHSGRDVPLTFFPAPVGTGIEFVRTDKDIEGRNPVIKAKIENVADTTLCTQIVNADGVGVGTIEHLMAAIVALGIDNMRIHVGGPEVPIMDGSSLRFIEMLDRAGIEAQDAPRKAIKIIKPVQVESKGRIAILKPSSETIYSTEIDFEDSLIGHQHFEMVLTADNFREELAAARTFGYVEDVEMLQKMGKAMGATPNNAVAVKRSDKTIVSPEGLRYKGNEEFVRHKMLDAVGDLALWGAPIVGTYYGYKAGHEMHALLLKELAQKPDCWIEIDLDGAGLLKTLPQAADVVSSRVTA